MEAFCAEHKEGIDEVLYDWPATKFESLYEAYSKRKIANELSERRSLEMAAVWGNPNLDSEKNPDIRSKWMDGIDQRFSKAIAALYNDDIGSEEEEIDYDDPFFRPLKNKHKLPEPEGVDS